MSTPARGVRPRGFIGTVLLALVGSGLTGALPGALPAQGAPSASISGTVAPPNTLGVDTVTIYDQSFNLVTQASTAANGSYSVTGLAAGTYFVGFDTDRPTGTAATWSTVNVASFYSTAGGTVTAKPEQTNLWSPLTLTTGQVVSNPTK